VLFDDDVDFRHEADGFFEGDDDFVIMGDVGKGRHGESGAIEAFGFPSGLSDGKIVFAGNHPATGFLFQFAAGIA